MAQNENSGNTGNIEREPSKRGFAAMDAERQRKIASEGGRASHQSGRGHEWTSEEAREAGRKGGQASRGNRQPGNTTPNAETQSGSHMNGNTSSGRNNSQL